MKAYVVSRSGTDTGGIGGTLAGNALSLAVLITPFHNMALMSPVTRTADVDRHTEVFAEAVRDLLGQG